MVFTFRCPLCNDERRFGKEMQMYGIYVPERDAAWEMDGSAGAGLDGERRVPCDAKVSTQHNGVAFLRDERFN